jgi:hypothetical protein
LEERRGEMYVEEVSSFFGGSEEEGLEVER